ncbi:DUF2911 domain-containing protein [Algoriphagus namhaensis]
MFKKILLGLGILLIAFVAFIGYGMLFPASPPATAEFQSADLSITVNYSQPSKKGRLLFGAEEEGALQPFGLYWRLGANAATEISFSRDVIFGGKEVAKGTYRIYAVPGPETFEISLNNELGVYFGITEPNYELDVVKVDVPVRETASEVETFTIDFSKQDSGADMNISWGNTLLEIPIR